MLGTRKADFLMSETKAKIENDEDLAALKRIAAGDVEAFQALYRRYQPKTYRFIYALLRDEQYTEEVTNDVMMVVWKNASDFRGEAKVSTWIMGIAHRMGCKQIERLKRERLRKEKLQESDWQNVDDHAKQLMDAQWLDSGLDRLSVDHRMVVELSLHIGHSYEEISEIVGCPVNTVKTRMFHAKRQLQQHLKEMKETPISSQKVV